MAADVVDYKLYGDDMQLVEIELNPGESVRAEAGTMMYMGQGIEMETNLGANKGAGLGQALFGGLKRALTGESLFITNFTHTGQSGKAHVAFAAPYPGRIIPLELSQLGHEFICQKDAFLCAAKGIDVTVAFTKKLGAGFFGGEGFILQKLTGDGRAFIHAGGAVIERDLQAGEKLRIDTGCLVGMTKGVHYDVEFVGGFKNALFGGEGLFLATLTGPGKVHLQSLPFSRLADRMMAASRRNTGESEGVGGIGGAVLGGLLGGDNN